MAHVVSLLRLSPSIVSRFSVVIPSFIHRCDLSSTDSRNYVSLFLCSSCSWSCAAVCSASACDFLEKHLVAHRCRLLGASYRVVQASELGQKISGYLQMVFFRPILSNDVLLDASQLRSALRAAGVNTRRWTENVKLNLTVAEMRDLYHRLRQENLAEQEIAVWARSRNCGSA